MKCLPNNNGIAANEAWRLNREPDFLFVSLGPDREVQREALRQSIGNPQSFRQALDQAAQSARVRFRRSIRVRRMGRRHPITVMRWDHRLLTSLRLGWPKTFRYPSSDTQR